MIAPNGELAQNWLSWLGWSTSLWGALEVVTHPANQVRGTVLAGLFVLAIFVRFGGTHTKLLDNLRDNAYGIYLTHYVFVIWMQYFLLRFALSAVTKGRIVFVGALALSWEWATLRRAPAISHVI